MILWIRVWHSKSRLKVYWRWEDSNIALLKKKFHKIIRHLKNRWRNLQSGAIGSYEANVKKEGDKQEKENRKIKCKEYSGFRQAECADTPKKNETTSFNIRISDEELEGSKEEEEGHTSYHVAFNSIMKKIKETERVTCVANLVKISKGCVIDCVAISVTTLDDKSKSSCGSNEGVIEGNLIASYKLMLEKWDKMCAPNSKHKKKMMGLLQLRRH